VSRRTEREENKGEKGKRKEKGKKEGQVL